MKKDNRDSYLHPLHKKSPLKGADQTLVQGAYRAAAAGIDHSGQDGMGQAMDSIIDLSKDAVNLIATQRAEKIKEGDDLADGIMETGGSLGTGWLDCVTGEVETLHGDYSKAAKWGRKNKRDKNMQSLNTLSSEVATIKDLNTSIAESQQNKDWSNSVSPKEQTVFNAFMSNDSKKRISKDENGNRTYEVYIDEENGWMSTSDISRMADEHQKDYTTMVDIRKQAIDIKAQAEKDAKKYKEANGNYVPEGYDRTKATSKMDNTLRNANLKSLMHDDVLENGTPWVDAVKENPEITGLTYESLGINPNLGSEQGATRAGNEALIGKSTIDLDGDGKVSEQELNLLSDEDRQLIIDALTNPDNELYDEDRTRGMMATYFTGFIGDNYDQSYKREGGGDQTNAKAMYTNPDGSVDLEAEASDFLNEIGITTNE